jgi:hypothetical protein
MWRCRFGGRWAPVFLWRESVGGSHIAVIGSSACVGASVSGAVPVDFQMELLPSRWVI